jgi:hypothetical protein
VTVPAGAWSSASGDWVVVTIDPATPPSGLTGLDVASVTVDITAEWALAGTEIHQFERPLDITFRNAAQGTIPATFDGAWRLLNAVPGDTLPASWDDGYYVSGSDVHILTRHLTLFALMRDALAPTPPTRFVGRQTGGTLTLSWAPGTDNSGVIAGYQVYVDGEQKAAVGAAERSFAVGPFDPNDAHAYTVSDSDAAGNVSGQTRRLGVVPELVGLPLEQARATLAAREFSLGTITRVEASEPEGTVVGPADVVMAEIGSAVDVEVSTGKGDSAATPAGTKLAFNVVSTKRFAWQQRSYLGARVKVTRAATLTVRLAGQGGVRLYTWRLKVKAGATILKLPMPREVRRPGLYRLEWVAVAGTETVKRSAQVRIVARPGGGGTSKRRVDVVLAGSNLKDLERGFDPARQRAIAADDGAAFDVTGDPRTDVKVIIVDADEYGLSLVHDLRTVFPSIVIVALSNDSGRLSRAVTAGATIALPKTTSPAQLAKIVTRLARG